VNKSEIAETFKNRDINKGEPAFIMKMLKKLKKSRINEKLMTIQMRNLKFAYDIPSDMLEFDSVYRCV
jgi:hypothetical protein